MKKIICFSALALVFCSAFTLFSEPSKDILGSWKIDEGSIENVTTSIIALTSKSNPDLAAQLEEQKESVKDMVRSMAFEYKADNTYQIQTPQGPQSGKWSFEDDNKILVVTRTGKPDRKDKVLEISSTRLRLVNSERGDTTLFIRP
jgi:outer membrane lipoprotein-sorting protein